MMEVRPEIVFHLAAQALVRASYDAPADTFEVNVGGTVSVLEAVRACPDVRAVLVVTSDKCYENREWDYAYREEDALGGHDPYSASKAASEIVTHAYRRSFFSGAERGRRVGVATARAGNVMGGGDWAADRLVPDCVRALARGQPVVLRNPGAVRPWQHVLEPLHGYLRLGVALLEPRDGLPTAFNFGPPAHDVLTVGEVARAFVDAWPGGGSIIVDPGGAEPRHEASLLRLASDRATIHLGWRPVVAAREGITWTVEWYRAWREARRSELVEISLGQIREYARRTGQPSYG
jgi:CDP-glucose 4,6-dehydratase